MIKFITKATKILAITIVVVIIVALGIILFMFVKSDKKKDVGMVFLGFATLMFGMETMTDAVSGLKNVPAFQELSGKSKIERSSRTWYAHFAIRDEKYA